MLHISDSYSRLNKLFVIGVSFVEFDMLVLSTDCSAVCTVSVLCNCHSWFNNQLQIEDPSSVSDSTRI